MKISVDRDGAKFSDGTTMPLSDYSRLCDILQDVSEEFHSASRKNGKFHSMHEGYAVLAEEVDELWDEVKKKSSKRNKDLMRREAIQVAAMAVRYIYDLL